MSTTEPQSHRPPRSVPQRLPTKSATPPYRWATEELVKVVQRLSLARDLDAVSAIVRIAARELTGADGATFVLREGDQCFYADENAIAPLWKGRRFPLDACVSGWVMLHRQPALIEDIYQDVRVPVDAYRPTFVRSMAMVPIRTLDPIGAIGNYWSKRHRPTAAQVKLLQALADTTAVALENVRVYSELEQRVRDRTSELLVLNEELRAEVSVRKKAEEEVRRLSLTDELTGLHNRRAFFLLAENELALARRNGSPAWLIFADVDGLKQTNDTYGHEVGDELLREAGRILSDSFRDVDIVARLSGDEFAVLAVAAGGSEKEIMDRLQTEIDRFNGSYSHRYRLSISLGIVPCGPTGTLEQLLAHADEAMYRHKRTRKDSDVCL